MLKTDAEGFVLNEAGERIKDGEGNLVQIEQPFMSQEQVNKVVQDRLDRERKKLNLESSEKINELTKKLEATVSLEEKANLEGKIHELNESLLSADDKAKKAGDLKLNEEKRKTEEATTKASDYEKRYKDSEVSNSIVTLASREKFMDSSDPLGILKDKVVWEKDDEGKETFKFQMQVKDKDGKLEERLLGTEEAVKVIAADKPYLIRGTNRAGGPPIENPYKNFDDKDIDSLSPEGKMSLGFSQNAKNM